MVARQHLIICVFCCRLLLTGKTSNISYEGKIGESDSSLQTISGYPSSPEIGMPSNLVGTPKIATKPGRYFPKEEQPPSSPTKRRRHESCILACGSNNDVDEDDLDIKMFRCECSREFETRKELDNHLLGKNKRRSHASMLTPQKASYQEKHEEASIDPRPEAHIVLNQEHGVWRTNTYPDKEEYLCLCGNIFPTSNKRSAHIYKQTRMQIVRVWTNNISQFQGSHDTISPFTEQDD